MIRAAVFLCLMVSGLSACASPGGGTDRGYVGPRTQGIYVRPAWQNPEPLPAIPAQDICNSRLYIGLVGRHEGSIYMAALPGEKRVIKRGYTEAFDDPTVVPPLMEVRDFVPDQPQYAPSVRTVNTLSELGLPRPERLLITLDADGYVEEVSCG